MHLKKCNSKQNRMKKKIVFHRSSKRFSGRVQIKRSCSLYHSARNAREIAVFPLSRSNNLHSSEHRNAHSFPLIRGFEMAVMSSEQNEYKEIYLEITCSKNEKYTERKLLHTTK